MESININNYEAFLLDYYEGNLNAEFTIELKRFADQHPELGIEFDAVELPKVEPLNSDFDLKNSLKRETQSTENEKVISFLEGLLSAIELEDFENDLKSNHELHKLLNRYKQTYFSKELEHLKLDKNLVYIQDFFSNQKRIFDYMEGNLTDDDKLCFEDELLENKAIQKQLKAYIATQLIPEIEIVDKQLLYRTEDDLIISNKTILVLEGGLSEQSLTNIEKEELIRYQKTVSKSDLNVTYPFKQELKKQPTKVISLFGKTKFWSAAATMVFTLSMLVLFLKDSDKEGRVSAKILLKNQINIGSTYSNPKSNQASNLASTKPNYKNKMLVKYTSTKPYNQSVGNDTTTLNIDKQLAIVNQTVQPTINSNPEYTLTIPISNSTTPTFSEEKTEAILVLNEEKDTETETDDIKKPTVNVKKSNLWSKAVKLANNLNGLGLKSLKAKDFNNEYTIAYNSFGIEKK